MKGQIKAERTTAVTIRESIYNQLRDYRSRHELAPPIVSIVSVAVQQWLDKQEEG
jgi:hypothetical protein